MIVRAAITASSQPQDLIDDERVQRESCGACHSFMSIDCIQHGCIHDTGSVLGAGYVYLTWVLAASRSPEPHTHEDAIPHLPVVKELPSL